MPEADGDCRTCKNAKRKGWKMTYCLLLGIDTRSDRTGCRHYQSKIVLESGDAEIIKAGSRADVRQGA